MRDNWAVGWSQRYTVGVWVGNARGAPMWDVSGTSGAAPVWAETMRYLHAATPSRAPAPPPGLVQLRVDFGRDAERAGEMEAARSEWFIQGTQQARFAIDAAEGARGSAAAPLRITAPADGTIVALDPDIPPQRQRLAFTANHAGGRWLLDGQPWARGAQVQWLPWPGKHRVQLLDARGQVADEVRVEVRGAGVREAARPARASATTSFVTPPSVTPSSARLLPTALPVAAQAAAARAAAGRGSEPASSRTQPR
jgi:penicillin-binding protein 1C